MRDRPDAVEPLDPPAGAKVGDRVTAQGQSDGAPDAQLKSKQKVWETLQVCTLLLLWLIVPPEYMRFCSNSPVKVTSLMGGMQVDLKTSSERVATWQGQPLVVCELGPVTAASLAGVEIK